MRHPLLAVLLCAWLPAASAAREQAAHEHGAARLDIVWIEGELELQLEGPAFNFLGFERAPASAEERAEFDRVRALLADAAALYALPADADCRAMPAQLDLSLPAEASDGGSSAHEHKDDHDHDSADAKTQAEAGHSHWRISHRLRCSRPDALAGFELALFERFASLQRLDFQLLTASRQSGGRVQRAVGPARIELWP